MDNSNNIYGKNAVIEALSSGNREFNRILISNTARSDEKIEKIKELAKANGIVFQFVGKEKLNQLINKNFDLRCKIYKISPDNMELVKLARSCGVSAKFAGSGGTIIGMYPDEETLHRLVVKMKEKNIRVIKPYIS